MPSAASVWPVCSTVHGPARMSAWISPADEPTCQNATSSTGPNSRRSHFGTGRRRGRSGSASAT
ncbi:hypothetical protein [Pseudofrankia sp. BMG5.37]|uniref:hypothetical protein n=1 Tax=Pseudofrankia sp. BMG5.37 TaxID=3050035 RepID=UPI002893A437|nr:hypothetical protein [Pseudofrankia sp. BMG5.37]MDT3444756.1 hypothetical protein [Pseudofrankia sp. BMG5.37]